MGIIQDCIKAHSMLWGKHIGQVWDRLSLMEKIAWIFFINNLIAILTIFELLILKYR